MPICENCKKWIKGDGFFRRTCDAEYNPKIEYYCNECARSMVDEHTYNGLIYAYFKENTQEDKSNDV